MQSETFRTYVDYQAEADPTIIATHSASRYRFQAFESAMALAENYYVHPDMQTLIQAAAESFPEDEVILKSDQPSEAGFIYYPNKIRILDLRHRVMTINSILWWNDRIWAFGDTKDPEDEVWQMKWSEEPPFRYDIVMMQGFKYERRMPLMVTMGKGMLSPDSEVEIKVEQGRISFWSDEALDVNNIHQAPSPILKVLLSTWRLMQQTITTLDREEKHPKPAMRYAARAKVPTGVTVIALRRSEGREPTSSGTPLTYRQLVRGHWRRVWCGPADNRYQRAVYIHSFIRGPEDASLIITDKVNALVR